MKTKVGILLISYSLAMSSHSSTSTFKKITFSISYYRKIFCKNYLTEIFLCKVNYLTFDNSSNLGAIILQGPHHVAKKSTTTKLSPAFSSWLFRSACKDNIQIHYTVKCNKLPYCNSSILLY